MPARKTVSSKNSRTASTKLSPAVSQTTPARKLNIKDLIIPVVIVAIALLVWFFKNEFIVATVNGQPITRYAVIKELEKKNGKTVLESLVTEKLITQEAENRKVEVTTADVNKEISNIEKSITSQGQNLDLILSQQGMNRADLTKQVKLQLMLKKMVGNTDVTQKDVDDYIEKNKASFPEGTDPKTMEAQIKQQLQQQKLGEKIQAFIASLQKKAKINYLKTY